jgi:ABC-type sugar transport system ATPase subunit
MPDRFIVRLNHVTKQYQSATLGGVREIDLEVERGKILAIVGESGSGKSTLLKLIYGLLAPDSGEILCNDTLVPGPHEKLIPGHDGMKMVAQDFNLHPFTKVYDNIAGMLANIHLEVKRQKTIEVMEFLKIDHLAQKRVVDLSGGEQQRVAIARAVITDPEILLMDEPFSQVDALLKNQLRADVKRLSEHLGITIILVSHDPADGLSLADQMVILRNGTVLESGTPENLYNNPQYLHTAQLLANCNVISAADAHVAGIEAKKDTVVIYPEWIELGKSWSSKTFNVKYSFFKGFYRELVLEKDQLILRAMDLSVTPAKGGEKAYIKIKRYLEFD